MCPNFTGSPTFHFKRSQRILWNTWLLGRSILDFVFPDLKLHNRYCHTCHASHHDNFCWYESILTNCRISDWILSEIIFFVLRRKKEESEQWISCSPDLTTNSRATNSEFSRIFKEQSGCLSRSRHQTTNFLSNKI